MSTKIDISWQIFKDVSSCDMRVSKLCPEYRYATKTQISLDPKKYRYVGATVFRVKY
jgi:hypothetical protein